jgi:putative endopeptidase
MHHTVRRTALTAALLAGAALAGFAQAPPAQPAQEPIDSGRPAAIPRFDAGAVDRSVQPCDDFYQYSCGQWVAKNPIPPDRSRWGRLSELRERFLDSLDGFLEKAA